MVMTMVTKSPRRNRNNRRTSREELRNRIADAALSLFHEAGYDAVSVDQIVSRAGVSKGTFFNFFPTKVDVLIVYFQEIDRQLAALRVKLDPRRPQLALEKFFARAERLFRSEGALIETLSRVIWANPALREADRTSAVRDRRGFAEFFRRAQAEGAIDSNVDPAVAADMIGDLWSGSVLLWLALGRRDSLARNVRPKLRLLFSGLSRAKK
jgi:AcrR family transcriptional regulator